MRKMSLIVLIIPPANCDVRDVLLEKAMTEFHKILPTHYYPQDEHL